MSKSLRKAQTSTAPVLVRNLNSLASAPPPTAMSLVADLREDLDSLENAISQAFDTFAPVLDQAIQTGSSDSTIGSSQMPSILTTDLKLQIERVHAQTARVRHLIEISTVG